MLVCRRIQFLVPLADHVGLLGVARDVGVEHVLDHLLGDQPEPDDGLSRRHRRRLGESGRAFSDVLGVVADPLQHARGPQSADDLAQILGHRLA